MMLISPVKYAPIVVPVALLNLQGQLADVRDGMVDTGALCTCIPWKCKKTLRLRAKNFVRLKGFDPRVPAKRYPLYYVSLRVSSLSTVRLKVIAVPKRVRVLLGRDFLRHHVFVHDGPNDWAALDDSAAIGLSLRNLFH